MVLVTVEFDVLISEMVPSTWFETQTVAPFGLTAI